jgi:hypothetical protein
MRKYFLLVYIVLTGTVVSGQVSSSYRNLEKYWWYRYRLVNDFMVVGEGCGESIPARKRSISTSNGGILEWGDATEHLGNYINFLAGEYKMLHDNGFNTNRTNYELYCALRAFDRLDSMAETYSNDIDGTYMWLCYRVHDYTGAIWRGKNGFFIRDDVPGSQPNLKTLGYPSMVDLHKDNFNRPGIVKYCGVSVATSDYSSRASSHSWPAGWTKRVPVEESKDQLTQLYAGMGMATRLLDGGAVYNRASLRNMAGEQMYRMFKNIQLYNAPNGHGGWNDWDIWNPVTNQCVHGIAAGVNCNAGGGDFNFLSAGAIPGLYQSALGNGVTASQLAPLSGFSNTPIFQAVWQIAQFSYPSLIPDAVFSDTYAAFSNNWYYIVPVLFWGTPIRIAHRRIVQHATSSNWAYPHTPLIYDIVSGGGTGTGVSFTPGNYGVPSYPALLDAAPFCGCHNYKPGGPFGNTTQEWGSYYWSNHNILTDFWNRGQTADNDDYNNVDYMVVHNLYNLMEPGYIGNNFFNSYYREDYNYSMPTPGGLGSKKYNLRLNFLEYASFINKVNNNADFKVRGAKVLDFKPGFEAIYGSLFDAYIKDYYCQEESYHYAETRGFPIMAGLSSGEEGNDSAYHPLDSPPDGVSFHVDNIPNPDYVPEDTTIDIDGDSYYRDSLINVIYASGDSGAIRAIQPIVQSINASKMAKSTGQQFSNASVVHIYPNPSDGRFIISTDISQPYDIQVLSCLGVIVYQEKQISAANKVIQLDAGLPPGTYTVQLTAPNKRFIQKLSIVR